MTSVELRRLNAYPELKTLAGINSVIDYVNSLIHPPILIPAGLNVRQRNRFVAKYGQGDWRVQIGAYGARTLFYNPPTNNLAAGQQNRINLEVVPPNPATRNNFLTQIYNSRTEGLGLGLNQFYYQVNKLCLGITRRETSAFLRRQGDYQVSRPIQKKLNRPILARCPNETWEIDCIDLPLYPQNPPHNNNRFIMTVVDVFSKKVFARAIPNQTSATCANALQNIFNATNTIPHVIQTDGGGSFLAGFHALVVANNITHNYTRSHTPTSNGVVERMNAEIRKKIRHLLVTTNNLSWTPFLNQICDNINNQKSSSTGFTPNELWTQGYNPPANALNRNIVINDRSSYADIREKAIAKQVNRAAAAMQNQDIPNFAVGDQVRMKWETMMPEMRQRNKEKANVKYNAVTYTPEIFIVNSVLNQNIAPAGVMPVVFNVGEIRNRRYTLRTIGGVVIHQANDQNLPVKLFYGSDLIRVPPNSTPTTVQPSFAGSRRLNRFV